MDDITKILLLWLTFVIFSFQIATLVTFSTYFPENYLVVNSFEEELEPKIYSEWKWIEGSWFTAKKLDNHNWRIYTVVTRTDGDWTNGHLIYNSTSKTISGNFVRDKYSHLKGVFIRDYKTCERCFGRSTDRYSIEDSLITNEE